MELVALDLFLFNRAFAKVERRGLRLGQRNALHRVFMSDRVGRRRQIMLRQLTALARNHLARRLHGCEVMLLRSLLFRGLPVDFPLTISVVRSYAEAGKPGA